MASVLDSSDIAVRLADEGVPLRAIARAVRMPSSDLREQLHEALYDGRLLELPHDDWPPGFPRDQRALQLSRLVVEHKDTISLTIGRMFGLTATEVRLLLLLLQSAALDKNRSDMSGNTIDVHVFHIRKRLQPHGIEIATLWGYGYQLSARDRRKVMDLILRHVAAPPAD
jgi:DNA-binding response OmpR family regulator